MQYLDQEKWHQWCSCQEGGGGGGDNTNMYENLCDFMIFWISYQLASVMQDLGHSEVTAKMIWIALSVQTFSLKITISPAHSKY